MAPVGFAQEGCVISEAVGASGKAGTAFTVAKVPVVIHVVSNWFLTLKLYPPELIPENKGDV
jgi:hypothetical protein